MSLEEERVNMIFKTVLKLFAILALLLIGGLAFIAWITIN